jgi:ElaB/YqjD/DUF883 family membrane-anchored ribosome-binding protein
METHFPNMDTARMRIARERLLSDLKALASDAESLLRVTAGDAGNRARAARARLTSIIEKAKTACEDLQSRGAESARNAARKADRTIRDHPYESLGIAFGTGLLVGLLFKRR